jgi:hypothetical protein
LEIKRRIFLHIKGIAEDDQEDGGEGDSEGMSREEIIYDPKIMAAPTSLRYPVMVTDEATLKPEDF